MSAPVEWYRAVHKHEHAGYPPRTYPCDRPWSALCQSEGPDHCGICWYEDCASQEAAMTALEKHVREGGCDPMRDLGPGENGCTIADAVARWLTGGGA